MKHFKKALSLALAVLMVVGGLVIAPVDAKAEGTYTRVTEVSTIKEGGNFVIVVENSGTYYAMNTVTSGKISPVEVTVTGNTLSGSNIPVWTVASTTLGVSLAVGTYYLGYSSSTNFATGANNTDDGNQWIVEEAGTDLFRFFSGKTKDEEEGAKRAITYRSGTTNKWAPYSTYNLVNANEEYTFDFMVFEYSGTVEVPQDIELPANATPEQIVNAAYEAVDKGVSLKGTWTLEGVITSIDTTYSSNYKNITVTIQVGDMSDKLLKCYRLTVANQEDTAELAKLEALSVGDIITVKGEIGSKDGKPRFVEGSTLEEVKAGEIENTLPDDATPEQIVNAAYDAMNNGTPIIGEYKLTGVITSIDTPYSEQFENITVTMVVGNMNDKPIQCYRLAGTGADGLEVGDTITVNGTFGSYNGKVQYNQGAELIAVEKGELENTLPEDATPEQIVNAAYDAMNNNTPMIGEYKLTGVITSIDTEYSEEYENITVTMVVDGMTDKPIQCFRLAGTGVDKLKVGDTITVNGTFGNYNGKVQYNQGSTLVSYTSAGGEIEAKGDMTMPVAVILFAGCALVAVAVVSKKRMA